MVSMGASLDLLLLTDEVHSAEYSRYNVHALAKSIGVHKLAITDEEKSAAAQKYAVDDYCVLRSEFEKKGFIDTCGFVLPHRPSLALCDLATVAAAAGYRVRVIDNFLRYGFRSEHALDVIRSEKPTLIGISTTLILSSEAVTEFVETIRQMAPSSKIVLGGPTVRRDDLLHGVADFAVFGSGEEPMLGILQVLNGKIAPSAVPHIAYRDASGTLCYTGDARSSALQLGKAYKVRGDEQIPVPDWSLYPRRAENVFPIEFSRGCKYNCYYCSYDRGKLIRDFSDVRRELLMNAEAGIRRYRFGDSNFTDGPPKYPRYPHDICKLMIELNLGLEWSCYARVDDLSPELADLMRRAGCFGVFFGVESGDDRILKLMRKGHDSADAMKGITTAKNAGLYVHTNFVVGYPGENEESYSNTLAFIEKSGADTVTFSHFFAEDNAPVKGPKMAEYNLQGNQNNWSHATMDSKTADQLISKGISVLRNKGITIASEYEIVGLMSFGLSFEESKLQFNSVNALGAKDSDKRTSAEQWLKNLYLERLPSVISAEQRLMRAAVGS